MDPLKRRYKNRVLSALPTTEIESLERDLTPVQLKQNMPLLDGNNDHGYFLEQGIASVVNTVENGTTVEVGVVGFEGVVGIPILLGVEGTPGRTFIQIEGSGFRIGAQHLKNEFERLEGLRRHLQRYLQAFIVQSAQTATCNRLHNIEERLARWLLTCRDRMETNELRLTHDFLGEMLGSPRTTVTLAAGLLQKAGLIDYSRGVVTIENRSALEDTACECYRVVRDEFQRLSLF